MITGMIQAMETQNEEQN